MSMAKQNLLIRNTQAPGDILMLSAAVRDLHRCYPDQFNVQVDTTATEVWENNPYITKVPDGTPSTLLGYPLIHRSNQCGIHFLNAFIFELNQKFNLKVRLTEFRPDLHWTEDELTRPPIAGDYWLIVSGGKADFTAKWWDPIKYQEVVDKLAGEVKFVQIGNRPDGGGSRHYHPPLRGTTNMVGQTNLREAFRLLLHSKGIVCPITCFMHAAAAMCKPAVVIAGGREPYTWEAYAEDNLRRNMAYAAGLVKQPVGWPDLWNAGSEEEWSKWSPETDNGYKVFPFVPHAYMHTQGKLPCCTPHACWKAKLSEGRNPKQNCTNIIKLEGRQEQPQCMDMITSDQVVAAIRQYNSQPLKPVIEVHKPVLPSTVISSTDMPGTEHFKFPVTIGVITCTQYSKRLQTMLASLYKHTPVDRFKLRIGYNGVPLEDIEDMRAFLKPYDNYSIFESVTNKFKCPMMKNMLVDVPVKTDWIVWMDDDIFIEADDWLDRLKADIDKMYGRKKHEQSKGTRLFGKRFYMAVDRPRQEWIEAAKWYKQRPVEKHENRHSVPFARGAFWALETAVFNEIGWPDERLTQLCDDIALGAAVWQAGYEMEQSYYGINMFVDPLSRRNLVPGYEQKAFG